MCEQKEKPLLRPLDFIYIRAALGEKTAIKATIARGLLKGQKLIEMEPSEIADLGDQINAAFENNKFGTDQGLLEKLDHHFILDLFSK